MRLEKVCLFESNRIIAIALIEFHLRGEEKVRTGIEKCEAPGVRRAATPPRAIRRL